MSASQAPGSPGTNRAVRDTIDFIYNQGVEGNVGANAEVTEGDYTTVEGDNSTDSDEILEVTKIEYEPPVQADGSLHTIDHIRLFDGNNLYEDLRYRAFMMGYFGADFRFTTPQLANPVLSGQHNPEVGKFNTATPKYGPSTTITPELANDGTAIDDSFRIRLHVWRWKGSDSELEDFFRDAYGRTEFQQHVTLNNPFTGTRGEFTRGKPIQIKDTAGLDPKRQFTKLMGGVNQELPKARPWVTWADNNNRTTTNTPYKFEQAQNRVDVGWKELDFDLTDGKEARFFDYVMVNEPEHLQEGVLVMDERDEDPVFQLTANVAHELPVVQPLDARVQPHDAVQLPQHLGPVPDPERPTRGILGHRQILFDDGGGFRVEDDGTALDAGDVRVGVQGLVLELES